MLTSALIAFFMSSLFVRPAVKTAMGVILISEPLLYEVQLAILAASTHTFYDGSSSINNGDKA